MSLTGTHLLMTVIDMAAVYLIASALNAMGEILVGIATAAPFIQVPIRQSFVFFAPALFVAHIALFTSNRFAPPRPRLTKALTVAFAILWLGGIPAGWGLSAWFAYQATSAGYAPCSNFFSKPYDMLRPYGLSQEACSVGSR